MLEILQNIKAGKSIFLESISNLFHQTKSKRCVYEIQATDYLRNQQTTP